MFIFIFFLMIRRPPRSTRTDTPLSLHDALPICRPLHEFAGRVRRKVLPAGQRRDRTVGRNDGDALLQPRQFYSVATGRVRLEPRRHIARGDADDARGVRFGRLGGPTVRPLWRGECRSEEQTSALQSLMRISYAVFCL